MLRQPSRSFSPQQFIHGFSIIFSIIYFDETEKETSGLSNPTHAACIQLVEFRVYDENCTYEAFLHSKERPSAIDKTSMEKGRAKHQFLLIETPPSFFRAILQTKTYYRLYRANRNLSFFIMILSLYCVVQAI